MSVKHDDVNQEFNRINVSEFRRPFAHQYPVPNGFDQGFEVALRRACAVRQAHNTGIDALTLLQSYE